MLLKKQDDDPQTIFYISYCKYCGRPFIKTHNRTVYCSNECRQYSDKEHTSKRVRRFYKKHGRKDNKWLGTGTLGAHCHKDWDYELLMITREKKRLKIKT